MTVGNKFDAAGTVATLHGEGFANPQAFAVVKGRMPVDMIGPVRTAQIIEYGRPGFSATAMYQGFNCG